MLALFDFLKVLGMIKYIFEFVNFLKCSVIPNPNPAPHTYPDHPYYPAGSIILARVSRVSRVPRAQGTLTLMVWTKIIARRLAWKVK